MLQTRKAKAIRGRRRSRRAASVAKDHNMPEELDITIRVVMFRDGGLWVAQCLEYDIGAQAEDIDTLNDRLKVALKNELRESMEQHGKPFAGINQAPERFYQMWERRARSVEL